MLPETAVFTKVATELKIKPSQVAATAELLAGGGTVPFIARYRKEATGMLDEVQITSVRDRLLQIAELDQRRTAILKSLDERKLLSDSLRSQIDKAETMARLEDIFAPFRPKRRTRATIAKEKGLEPLAEWLLAAQADPSANPAAEAARFLREDGDEELRVKTTEEALAGARDVIAERIADDAAVRSAVRKIYEEEATVTSKVLTGKEADNDAAKYRDYFEWSEPLAKVPSHRLLAMRRGEKEGFLMLRVTVPEDRALDSVKRLAVTGRGPAADQIGLAAVDGCKRLLFPAMETESRLASKKKADAEAIRVFADNIRELLLAAPLGQKRLLAIDPGFRTGCKTVVLDAQGKLLHHDVIYPTAGSQTQLVEAARTVLTLIEKHRIEAIAPSAMAPPAANPKPSSAASNSPQPSPSSPSTKAALPSTPPATSPARNSPTKTSRSAEPSPSAVASWTRSPNWSRSTRKASASASTSTTSISMPSKTPSTTAS